MTHPSTLSDQATDICFLSAALSFDIKSTFCGDFSCYAKRESDVKPKEWGELKSGISYKPLESEIQRKFDMIWWPFGLCGESEGFDKPKLWSDVDEVLPNARSFRKKSYQESVFNVINKRCHWKLLSNVLLNTFRIFTIDSYKTRIFYTIGRQSFRSIELLL